MFYTRRVSGATPWAKRRGAGPGHARILSRTRPGPRKVPGRQSHLRLCNRWCCTLFLFSPPKKDEKSTAPAVAETWGLKVGQDSCTRGSACPGLLGRSDLAAGHRGHKTITKPRKNDPWTLLVALWVPKWPCDPACGTTNHPSSPQSPQKHPREPAKAPQDPPKLPHGAGMVASSVFFAATKPPKSTPRGRWATIHIHMVFFFARAFPQRRNKNMCNTLQYFFSHRWCCTLSFSRHHVYE